MEQFSQVVVECEEVAKYAADVLGDMMSDDLYPSYCQLAQGTNSLMAMHKVLCGLPCAKKHMRVRPAEAEQDGGASGGHEALAPCAKTGRQEQLVSGLFTWQALMQMCHAVCMPSAT